MIGEIFQYFLTFFVSFYYDCSQNISLCLKISLIDVHLKDLITLDDLGKLVLMAVGQ